MGCGNTKVLPRASVKGYVRVMQSPVAFGKAQDHCEEAEKSVRKQWSLWSSISTRNCRFQSGFEQLGQRGAGKCCSLVSNQI